MTANVTTDHQLIRETVRLWLQAGAGVSQVIYANQEVPRPAKPYATILVVSSGQRFGLDETRQAFDATNEVVQRTVAGPRQMILQCEVYTDPATAPGQLEAAERLENALLMLDTVGVRSAFRAAKIAVAGHNQVTRLDEQLGDRWERRAVVDVTVTYSGETFDDGLTGEDGNWVETVEVPGEGNGNLDPGTL